MELDAIVKLISAEQRELAKTYSENTKSLIDQYRLQTEQQKQWFSQLQETMTLVQSLLQQQKEQTEEYTQSIQALTELLQSMGQQTDRLETVTLALIRLQQ